MLCCVDATTVTENQLASRDVTGSRAERRGWRGERALFIETDVQNVTVSPGDRAVLNCRVQQLGDKTVCRLFAARLNNNNNNNNVCLLD